MGIQGYITQEIHEQIVGAMEEEINRLKDILAQMVAPHDHASVSLHNDFLREENVKFRTALKDIDEKTDDNWAASRAQTALGCDKIVVY